ncbi:MAG TPA: S9 family peptidase, partial [Sphingomicrobium sp.]
MRKAFLGLLLMTVGAASAGAQQPASNDDPYIWLEDVSGQKAMDWVNSHNAKSQAVLEADPRYQQYYDEALAIAQ